MASIGGLLASRNILPYRALSNAGRKCAVDDLRDHNPNPSTASSQLHDLEGRRPAVPRNRRRPLATADARARPLRHEPSADRGSRRLLLCERQEGDRMTWGYAPKQLSTCLVGLPSFSEQFVMVGSRTAP
jgi:hypothetical protein